MATTEFPSVSHKLAVNGEMNETGSKLGMDDLLGSLDDRMPCTDPQRFGDAIAV